MTPSEEQQTIGEKVLELTKLLCRQESNFTLRVKCGDFRFYLDSKPRQITEAIPVKQQRKSPRQKERDKRRRMEFFERKTASSKNQVLGKKGSEGAETEGGNPLSTLSPARPPPPPPPPPVLTNRRVIVTRKSRSAISFVQLDGVCGNDGNDAEEEEEERRMEEGAWTAEDGSSFKQRASARSGDEKDPSLRERARDEEIEKLTAECYCGVCSASTCIYCIHCNYDSS